MRQEIVLGLGGAEMLKALGIDHYLLHLNEGHAAFALLERIRTIVSMGQDFVTASEKISNSTIFTTHTPVPAGHDVFSFPLIEKYFHAYWPDLGLDRDTFFQLGIRPEKPDAGFNMTAFALRLAGCRNAVSKRHAQVSRQMWRNLWPDVSEDQIQIEETTSNYDKEKLQGRLAKLAGGVAVINVGAATETEMQEKKDRIDNLQILFPMISRIHEIDAALGLLECAY